MGRAAATVDGPDRAALEGRMAKRIWRAGGVVAAAALLALGVARAAAAPGDLDPTFGAGGAVTTSGLGWAAAHALQVQPDGKIVTAGHGGAAGGSVEFALVRYNPDGSLDPDFGTGGRVLTAFGAGYDMAHALVLQPDGKIVAAGHRAGSDFALARYLPDGQLDPAFGTGGKITTDFGGSDEVANALVLQPDGKLVTAGYRCLGSGN
jgi:uncharacterized delta-60 repeat protein